MAHILFEGEVMTRKELEERIAWLAPTVVSRGDDPTAYAIDRDETDFDVDEEEDEELDEEDDADDDDDDVEEEEMDEDEDIEDDDTDEIL